MTSEPEACSTQSRVQNSGITSEGVHSTTSKFIKVSPRHLHMMSTSHTWIFSAIAELIDNAADTDSQASELRIRNEVINSAACLTFTDDGQGMSADKLYDMLSLGFSDKPVVGDVRPIGMYGSGFNTGSMRLGKDVLVLTKDERTMSAALLSQSYLKEVKAETIFLPMCTFDKASAALLDESGSDLATILQHSVLHSVDELLGAFEQIPANANSRCSRGKDTGTKIIIWNLSRDDADGPYELDFHSVDGDGINRSALEDDEPYKRSLQSYCSILYLKPRMRIFIDERRVKTKLMARSLAQTREDKYTPAGSSKPFQITFGYWPQTATEDYSGLVLYFNNRLITAFQAALCQRPKSEAQKAMSNFNLFDQAKGVVAICDVSFLEPTHNKQGFKEGKAFSHFMHTVNNKMKEYVQVIHHDAAESAMPDISKFDSPFDWAECSRCRKWRRLQKKRDDLEEIDWFCEDNVDDPLHNACDKDEEIQDSREWTLRVSEFNQQKKRVAAKRKAKESVPAANKRIATAQAAVGQQPAMSEVVVKTSPCSSPSPSLAGVDSANCSSNLRTSALRSASAAVSTAASNPLRDLISSVASTGTIPASQINAAPSVSRRRSPSPTFSPPRVSSSTLLSSTFNNKAAARNSVAASDRSSNVGPHRVALDLSPGYLRAERRLLKLNKDSRAKRERAARSSKPAGQISTNLELEEEDSEDGDERMDDQEEEMEDERGDNDAQANDQSGLPGETDHSITVKRSQSDAARDDANSMPFANSAFSGQITAVVTDSRPGRSGAARAASTLRNTVVNSNANRRTTRALNTTTGSSLVQQGHVVVKQEPQERPQEEVLANNEEAMESAEDEAAVEANETNEEHHGGDLREEEVEAPAVAPAQIVAARVDDETQTDIGDITQPIFTTSEFEEAVKLEATQQLRNATPAKVAADSTSVRNGAQSRASIESIASSPPTICGADATASSDDEVEILAVVPSRRRQQQIVKEEPSTSTGSATADSSTAEERDRLLETERLRDQLSALRRSVAELFPILTEGHVQIERLEEVDDFVRRLLDANKP